MRCHIQLLERQQSSFLDIYLLISYPTADYKLFFEHVEIAAVAAVTKSLGSRKSDFSQSAVSHVVNIAEQTAQLRAAVFHAGGVPKALCNCDVEVVFTVNLCTLL